MKNMNKLFRKGYSLRLLIVVTFLLFSSLRAASQWCLTSSLTINTGYNPATGMVITPGTIGGTAVQDPKWTVTALSTDDEAYLGAGPSYLAYIVPPVSGYGSCDWATNTSCNWISLMNQNLYSTTGSGTYTVEFSRSFQVCGNDNFAFDLEMAYDQNLVYIYIDGDVTSSYGSDASGTCSPWNTFHHYTFNRTLTSGTHTINIMVSNLAIPSTTNGHGMDLYGTVSSSTSSNTLVSEGSECADYVCKSCSDNCYWKVTGNNILDGNNIFGTLTNDDVALYTNNAQKGIFTKDGLFGWETTTPTAYLHVNCAGHNTGGTSSDVRFQGLETTSGQTNFVVIDNNGYLYNSNLPTTGTITGACGTINAVPKMASPSTITCSEIVDLGTSVGIGYSGSWPTTYLTWPGGVVGPILPPGSGGIRLSVNGVASALAYIATSDERFKTQINPIQDPFSIITKLNGKTYYWNQRARKEMGADTGKQCGFIAQEVAKVMPGAATVDSNGNFGIIYNAFIPVLTEGEKQLYQMYQDQKALNEKLQDQINTLQSKLDDLADCCAASKSSTGQPTAATDNVQPTGNADILYQNIPNPFSKETTIPYFIYKMNSSASIMISDMNGRELTKIPISAAGKGNVQVSSSNMTPGVYLYTLIVDDQVIDTKKMIIDTNVNR